MTITLRLVKGSQLTHTELDDNFVDRRRTAIGLSDSDDMAISMANTPQTIDFDTIDINEGFTYSSGEITFIDPGTYSFILQPQIANGSGSQTFTAWSDVDTGGGFVALPNSAAKTTMASNSDAVLVIGVLCDGAVAGDKIRFRMQATSTNVSLEATAASGPVPAIPSVILIGEKL